MPNVQRTGQKQGSMWIQEMLHLAQVLCFGIPVSTKGESHKNEGTDV